MGLQRYHGVIEILFDVATLGVITEIAYLAPSHEKFFRAIRHQSTSGDRYLCQHKYRQCIHNFAKDQ